MKRYCTFSTIVAALISLLFVSCAAVEPLPSYFLLSNASPELLDYYAELLEAYYSLMDDRFGINPGPELKRTK